MNINLDLVKSHMENLIKIIESTQRKAEHQSLTKQEFLQFLEEVKEKNSLVLDEIDTSIKF